MADYRKYDVAYLIMQEFYKITAGTINSLMDELMHDNYPLLEDDSFTEMQTWYRNLDQENKVMLNKFIYDSARSALLSIMNYLDDRDLHPEGELSLFITGTTESKLLEEGERLELNDFEQVKSGLFEMLISVEAEALGYDVT